MDVADPIARVIAVSVLGFVATPVSTIDGRAVLRECLKTPRSSLVSETEERVIHVGGVGSDCEPVRSAGHSAFWTAHLTACRRRGADSSSRISLSARNRRLTLERSIPVSVLTWVGP